MQTYWVRTFLAGVVWLLAITGCAGPESVPSEDGRSAPLVLAPGVFDAEQADTLGLSFAPGRQTFTVCRPGPEDYRYNHGAVVMSFQGRLYAQWQSSRRDEDAPETEIRYAISPDQGASWSRPKTLALPRKDATITNGGWWVSGDQLVAYINVWPHDTEPRGGFVEYVSSADGERWSEPRRVMTRAGKPLNGILEQDLRALPGGRILTTVHEQPGLIATPWFTDDPSGVSGWQQGELPNLAHEPAITRELEPSWYRRGDGRIVMTFRDQQSSFRILAAESRDRGASWTQPVITNFPDSRAKQSAGNLPDGSAFIVNNPSGSKTRIPLTIAVSKEGQRFDRAWLVRAGGADLQPWRYEGKYKRAGYSYPKSYVDEEFVYVAYATNKEDIEITRIPIGSLVP